MTPHHFLNSAPRWRINVRLSTSRLQVLQTSRITLTPQQFSPEILYQLHRWVQDPQNPEPASSEIATTTIGSGNRPGVFCSKFCYEDLVVYLHYDSCPCSLGDSDVRWIFLSFPFCVLNVTVPVCLSHWSPSEQLVGGNQLRKENGLCWTPGKSWMAEYLGSVRKYWIGKSVYRSCLTLSSCGCV
jgi:hypothetical protein